jgi:FkbM family methyltransferase
MRTETLERLRMQGYSPRTMLDVGAHVGTFTAMFLQTFPACRPTLIEPNPYCEEALAQLPFERHMVAASKENGEAELFLTKEWLQSTGTSLYRENSQHFRDEVVMRQPVPTARLDDLLAGRTFDFVKIDTQGAELDVLRGGAQVIRHADYVVVEVSTADYNPGSGRAEEVFAILGEMGFTYAEAMDVFRWQGEPDGRIMQIDYLFEQRVKRASQSLRLSGRGEHGALVAHLQGEKARHANTRILNIGTPSGWAAELADASLGGGESPAAQHFAGDLNRTETWEALAEHVARYGRFAFCLCLNVLERMADPGLALRHLPLVADAGFIAAPSRYLESLHPEGPWRGYLAHRWIVDAMEGDRLVLTPKLGLLEHLSLDHEAEWAGRPELFELQMLWRGGIDYAVLPVTSDAREAALRYSNILSRA